MARGLTAQDINTWNKKVKRAAEKGIYIGDRITRAEYNAMSTTQKRAVTRAIHSEKGRSFARGREYVEVSKNVKSTKEAFKRLKRETNREVLRRINLSDRLGDMDIKTPEGHSAGKVKDLQEFGNLIVYPRKKLEDYNFSSVKELENYSRNYGRDYEERVDEWKEKYIQSIVANINEFVPEERKQEFYDVIMRIKNMPAEDFLQGYYTTQESSITESFRWFYVLRWASDDEADEEIEELTNEYLDMLKRAFG